MARLLASVTGNLERLIFAATGLLALGAGAICALMIYSPHLRLAGSVGLASAGVAGLISAIRLWRRFRRRTGKPPADQGGSDATGAG